MKILTTVAASLVAMMTASSAFAQTEIQWWHAMTGANNDVVNKLAADFNVSVRYVHKAFANAGRGMTFLDTVQHERMEAAMRMLRTSNISNTQISQIAYSCGFTDPAYFGLVFRKYQGCAPGAFAKMHGLNPEPRLLTDTAAPPALALLE